MSTINLIELVEEGSFNNITPYTKQLRDFKEALKTFPATDNKTHIYIDRLINDIDNLVVHLVDQEYKIGSPLRK